MQNLRSQSSLVRDRADPIKGNIDSPMGHFQREPGITNLKPFMVVSLMVLGAGSFAQDQGATAKPPIQVPT